MDGKIRALLLFAVISSFLNFQSYGSVLGSIPGDRLSSGGLCVIIGGTEELEFAELIIDSGPWVVHWLDADGSRVDKARRELQRKGIYGRVTVEHWDKKTLPYAGNLVNLLIGKDPAQSFEISEIMRVIAPEGMAMITEGGGFVHYPKPRPEEMGEWTHPWQGANGNLASDERMLKVPNTFQWIAGPSFPLARRKDSAGALMSAGGRVFSITQNVPENIGGGEQNYLVARDAFNGIVLWSVPWDGPLSRGHADGYHEAVVVSENYVYGARDGGVVIFSATDGNVLEFLDMSATPNKLVLEDGILIAQCPFGLTGFNIEEGRQIWHFGADNPWGTVISDGRAFCIVGTREEDGRWKHILTALDQRRGVLLWEQRVESEYGHRNTAVLRLHFAGEGIVCLIERNVLRFLAAEDGRELWRRESETEARGSGGMDSRQVGHFIIDGKIWMRADRARGGREVPEKWLALDPMTGGVLREIEASGPQGVISNVNKVSCQPLTATANFVLDSRLSTIWDFETGQRQGYKFARGGCQVGMIPANGLAYVPPNACGCLEEQFRANMAVVHSDDAGLYSFVPSPLLRGPAYGFVTEAGDDLSGWPMYRRDGRRGAFLPESLPGKPVKLWETKITLQGDDRDGEWLLNFGHSLTPPVVAGGLVLVAEPQTHQVIAIDKSDGSEKWRFTAGGRVTTPPTFYRGLALFGSNDGYVYALRSDDGELVWRRRVAPSDRRIIAYGQVESTWPVSGGVLVHEGLAMVVAGRAVDEGSGLTVHAIDPFSGEFHWTRHVDNARYGMSEPLVTDGTYVYLLDHRIDAGTGEISGISGFHYGESERGGARVRFPEGIRYLRGGKAGLFETSWTGLDMGLRKAQQTWTWGNAEGEIIAFTGETSYAFQIDAGGLDARGRQRMWRDPWCAGGGLIIARVAGADVPCWSVQLPVPAQVEAMLTTTEALFISGPADRFDPGGRGFISIISHEQGNELSRIMLPAAPVHDGIAAANGSVYAVLRDGTIIRMGEAGIAME